MLTFYTAFNGYMKLEVISETGMQRPVRLQLVEATWLSYNTFVPRVAWGLYDVLPGSSRRHLKLLQWACVQDCPWNDNACYEAARKGHLGVLKGLRDQGCPWDEWTCAGACLLLVEATSKCYNG